MANRGELRAEVRELIGAGIFDRCYQTDWADEAIDFACEQVAALLGLTFAFSDSIAVTNRYAASPGDAIRVESVRTLPEGDVMGRMLLRSTRAAEDRKNPSWRDRTGEPTVWLEETGSTIRLNGQPTSNAVIVGYMQQPTAMTDDADTPDTRIPPALHPHLKYAAAAYLLNLEGQGRNPEKANELFSQFGILIGVGELKISESEVDR